MSGAWALLSNHGIALLCVARDPGKTLREIGDCVGVTERTAHAIVSDLIEDGYLLKTRRGSRNHYEVKLDAPMGHPMLSDHWVGELLAVLASDGVALHGGRSERGKTEPGNTADEAPLAVVKSESRAPAAEAARKLSPLEVVSELSQGAIDPPLDRRKLLS